MTEVLPIRLLTEEDSQIFGSLAVALGKLERSGLSVANGIVVTCPDLKLRTILEHYDFGSKEIFEQSLTLVKKEINAIPIPEPLQKIVKKQKAFLINSQIAKSHKDLWKILLSIWLEQIKERLWKDGFYKDLTEGLEPQIVIFVKKVKALGKAFFDPLQDEVVINIAEGKLHPNDLHKLTEIVKEANRKLFIPHEYEWILDHEVKLTKVLPYTPLPVIASEKVHWTFEAKQSTSMEKIATSTSSPRNDTKSAVKVFFDLSTGFTIEKNIDGIYIASEKIFDLNKVRDSFENLTYRLVESALTFPNSPVLFKLADQLEGMGRLRGTLRLLHQQSLLGPMLDALDFVRHQKGLINIHPVIPYVRGVNEFLQIKRELAIKKLMRKNSLQLWLEICVPENIINLEDYLDVGLDGVVLNLDELISHLNGFDTTQQELLSYKSEAGGLLKFLEDGIKLLHKSKTPFIAYGSLSLYPRILEFLVEKGVYGIVVEKYESSSAHELLRQSERRLLNTHQVCRS